MNDSETRSNLPAPRPNGSGTSALFTPQPRNTGGIVDTWLTRWEAKRKTAAHNQLAALNRAKADEIVAYGELAQSYMRTARTVAELDDLPDILALDKAERQATREDKLAALDYQRDERTHQTELTKRRRQREIEAADATVVDARRQKFNAEQGLENQERLKQINLEIWEKRTQALDLKAEHIRKLLQEDLGGATPESKQVGLLEQLESMHAVLVDQVEGLAADNRMDEAETYRVLLVELDKVLRAVRAG